VVKVGGLFGSQVVVPPTGTGVHDCTMLTKERVTKNNL